MVAKPKPMTARIKCGDDFRLQMAVRDRKSDVAVDARKVYDRAYQEWRDAVNADDPSDVLIAAKKIVLSNTLQDYEEVCMVDISNWIIKCSLGWGRKTYAISIVDFIFPIQGIFSIHFESITTASLKPREYIMEITFIQENQDVNSTENMLLIIDSNVVDML